MEKNNFEQNNQNNPQNGYQQSSQNYGYSQQSGNPYPPSANPYYTTGYMPQKKKSNTTQIAIISVVAVLIVALATILIFLLSSSSTPPTPLPPPPPIPGTVMINGQNITFDIIDEGNRTYLPVEDFAKAVGYECVIDNGKIKIIASRELVTLEIGSKTAEIKDQTTGLVTTANITTAPFERDGKVYIYAKDIVLFLQNSTVSYDTMLDIVRINVDMMFPPPPPGGPGGYPPPPPPGGPGGYMPPPPTGGQPQGGPAGQPPEGAPGGQPQKK